METLKSIIGRMTAARNAFIDATSSWDAKKGSPQEYDAQQQFFRTRRECEAVQYDFCTVLTDLKRRSLLRLAIDSLDQKTTMDFRHMISSLMLDSFVEPASYATFGDLAMAWFEARQVRDAAMHFAQIGRGCATAADLDAQLQTLTADEEEADRYVGAIERYRFLLELLTQSGEDVDAQWQTAMQKLLSRARFEFDEADGLLRLQIRSMGEGEYRRVLLDLPEEVSLLLRRSIDGGWMPEPQRQAETARTAVATLTSEAEESAADVGLSPEAEAQVDELLRSLDDRPDAE